MKVFGLVFLLFISVAAVAQGKFAGPVLKNLVNKIYSDNRKIPELSGYSFRQENLVTEIKDTQQINADVFMKGTSAVVFFSMLKDTVKKRYVILDVLEIKDIEKGWQVHTILCRLDKKSNAGIVALIKNGEGDYLNNVKLAWHFNRAKMQFESIPVTGIDCFNEGGD
jgi:hypothetical protein